MVIIVNSAFEEHDKQSDDEMATNDDTHLAQEIELALISVNTSINSSNGVNESPIDGEELDTSDNNTTNNTQTTAECDDKLLLHVDEVHRRNGSVNEDDDDSNSKDNYDMNYDDYYQDENLTDELKRKHTEEYGLRDVQNPGETEKLVNGENGGVDLEDCDYYSDGEISGIENSREDILKLKRDGDGIIANHFIGLYFFHIFSNKRTKASSGFRSDQIRPT